MSKKDDLLQFELAQTLRRSHCDRAGEDHECVGAMTVRRGEVCLDCPLCGKGEHTPGWNTFTADRLDMIFDAAGIRWDSMTTDAQVKAIQRYDEIHRATPKGATP